MASISVPGGRSWGNLYYLLLLDALGLFLCRGDGLRAPVLCGFAVAGMADHRRPQGYIAAGFLHPVQCDVPAYHRLLRRPQLLTRLQALFLGSLIIYYVGRL